MNTIAIITKAMGYMGQIGQDLILSACTLEKKWGQVKKRKWGQVNNA